MKTYTAKDLLEIYMDLYRLDGKPETWSEEKFINHPPCLYRYRQVLALIDALHIDASLTELSTGVFVERRDLETYPKANELVKFFFATYSKGFFLSHYEEEGGIDYDCFSGVYHDFFSFLELINRIVNFNYGVLEASTLDGLYRVAKTGSFINEQNLNHIEDMKNVLAAIIDPHDQSIIETQLVEQYNFPVVDLGRIDGEWMWGFELD